MENSYKQGGSTFSKGFSGLLSGSAFIFACRLSGAVLTFATQALLARWMGAEELGIYVLAFSWLILLSTVAGLGYPTAALKFIGQYIAHNDIAKIYGFIRHSQLTIFGISSTLASAAVLLIVLLKEKYIPATHADTLIVALLCLPVYALFNLHDRIAHAHTWFVMAMLPTMVLRPLLFFLIIYISSVFVYKIPAATSMSLHFMVFLLVASGQYLILHRKLRHTYPLTPASYETKPWRRTALPLLAISLFTQYTADINIIIAGFFLTPVEIAIYSVSFRVALLIGFAIFAVHSMLIPRISRLHTENKLEEMQRLVMHATQLTFVGSLTSLLLLFYFGKQLLGLFGEEFIVGFEPLMILAGSQLVIAMAGPLSALLSMTGLQRHCLHIFAWALLATILLNILLIPLFGINGAALSVLLVTLFWSIWAHALIARHLNMDSSILAFRNT